MSTYSDLQKLYPNDKIDTNNHIDTIMKKIASRMKRGNYKGTTIYHTCSDHELVKSALTIYGFVCNKVYDTCDCAFEHESCRVCRSSTLTPTGICVTL
jgi:hypothetical protein